MMNKHTVKKCPSQCPLRLEFRGSDVNICTCKCHSKVSSTKNNKTDRKSDWEKRFDESSIK